MISVVKTRLKSCEPEFLISTPGRLLELVSLNAVDISAVSLLVINLKSKHEVLNNLMAHEETEFLSFLYVKSSIRSLMGWESEVLRKYNMRIVLIQLRRLLPVILM